MKFAMRSGVSTAAIMLAASLTWAGAVQAQQTESEAPTTLAQASQSPGMTGQQQGMQPGQPGMMGQGQGMMGQGMMGPGMGQGQGSMGPGRGGPSAMGHGRGPGMEWMKRGAMRQHMMKVMFAIADQNGDGALSFNEVMDIHRRVFNAVDANKDGQITMEELRNFIQNP